MNLPSQGIATPLHTLRRWQIYTWRGSVLH